MSNGQRGASVMRPVDVERKGVNMAVDCRKWEAQPARQVGTGRSASCLRSCRRRHTRATPMGSSPTSMTVRSSFGGGTSPQRPAGPLLRFIPALRSRRHANPPLRMLDGAGGRNGKAYTEQEIVIERPDGGRRIALAYANPLYDEWGKLVGAVNVLVNVTDRTHSDLRPIGSHRRVVGRRHHQQRLERRYPELECRRHEAVWVHAGSGRGTAHVFPHPRQPS